MQPHRPLLRSRSVCYRGGRTAGVPIVPVWFVVDDAFEVLNWHYSDQDDEAASEQGIQDWLDRYFTS